MYPTDNKPCVEELCLFFKFRTTREKH